MLVLAGIITLVMVISIIASLEYFDSKYGFRASSSPKNKTKNFDFDEIISCGDKQVEDIIVCICKRSMDSSGELDITKSNNQYALNQDKINIIIENFEKIVAPKQDEINKILTKAYLKDKDAIYKDFLCYFNRDSKENILGFVNTLRESKTVILIAKTLSYICDNKVEVSVSYVHKNLIKVAKNVIYSRTLEKFKSEKVDSKDSALKLYDDYILDNIDNNILVFSNTSYVMLIDLELYMQENERHAEILHKKSIRHLDLLFIELLEKEFSITVTDDDIKKYLEMKAAEIYLNSLN